ncbi:MAG: copper ion binding protein, partial [Mobilitalea sp.]
MSKETIVISGMSCAACAMRVEKAVGKLDGVVNASVNFATEKLSVEFDEHISSIPVIHESIEKAGYGVVTESKVNTVTIPVGGMTCAACSQRVE